MRKSLAALAALGGGLAVARRLLRDWGATPVERVARLPGDDLVPGPAGVTTRAVTIDAPAEVVWRWLVQIGQDRAGFYSYDRLENLFRLHIYNARRIHPEWQQLSVGDTVRLVPRRWFGLREGVALPVVHIDPGRSIVLGQQPGMPWKSVWSFHVVPLTPYRCRLISRSRSAPRGRLAWLAEQLMDPITLLMTRRMLLGIRDRAEMAAIASCDRQRPEGAPADGRGPSCATATS